MEGLMNDFKWYSTCGGNRKRSVAGGKSPQEGPSARLLRGGTQTIEIQIACS